MNNDSTENGTKELIAYFEKQKRDSYNAYINIYKLQQSKSDYSGSKQTIDELRNYAVGITGEKSRELLTYCDVNEVYLQIIDDIEKDSKYLDSKKEMLYNAALDESPMYSALAEILYEYATDSEYAERRSPRQRQYTPLPWDEISPKSVKTTANTENVFKPELKVYPNPTQGVVFVEYDFSKTYSEGYDLLLNAMSLIREGDCNKGEIVVYSEDGRLLQTIKLNMTADIKTILMTDYTPGLYIIEISDCYGNKNSVKITKTK